MNWISSLPAIPQVKNLWNVPEAQEEKPQLPSSCCQFVTCRVPLCPRFTPGDISSPLVCLLRSLAFSKVRSQRPTQLKCLLLSKALLSQVLRCLLLSVRTGCIFHTSVDVPEPPGKGKVIRSQCCILFVLVLITSSWGLALAHWEFSNWMIICGIWVWNRENREEKFYKRIWLILSVSRGWDSTSKQKLRYSKWPPQRTHELHWGYFKCFNATRRTCWGGGRFWKLPYLPECEHRWGTAQPTPIVCLSVVTPRKGLTNWKLFF